LECGTTSPLFHDVEVNFVTNDPHCCPAQASNLPPSSIGPKEQLHGGDCRGYLRPSRFKVVEDGIQLLLINPDLRTELDKQLAAQRAALAKAGNTAVERLLIERALVSTIEVEFFTLTRAEGRGISLRQANYLERRQARADRRLTAALRTLVAVRYLLSEKTH
jgi:hypothetical protein